MQTAGAVIISETCDDRRLASYYFHDVDILLINTRMDGWMDGWMAYRAFSTRAKFDEQATFLAGIT